MTPPPVGDMGRATTLHRIDVESPRTESTSNRRRAESSAH
jgi:hypothetical protein